MPLANTRRQPPVRFAPQLLSLEDRAVPATFYVDPALVGSADGSTVTFGAGTPGAVPNLRYESTVAAYAADSVANPTATFAFGDLRQAVEASELNTGADTIRIAASATPIPLDNAAVTAAVTGGSVNSVTITQPLPLVGSGKGATTVAPTADTQFDDGTGAVADPLTAVFRVTDTAGLGASLSVSDLTFDGAGRKLGIGFSIEDGATGAFTGAAVRNVSFDNGSNSQGVAILGFRASSLTVSQSLVDGYGRVGVQFANTAGAVSGTTVTGRGAGTFFNSGVDVYGASTVTVSGSTITNNAGVVGSAISDGLLAYADPDDATLTPAVTAVGNAFSANGYALAVGLPGATNTDGSSLVAQYNNITGNAIGVQNQSGKANIQAFNNYWGNPSGPQNTASNPTGTGDPVTDRVDFLPVLAGVTPVVPAASVAAYLAAITTVTGTVVVDPTQGTTLSGGTGKFVVTFTQPVTGFAASDVTVTGPGVTSPVVTVTGSGTTYAVAVSGLPANQPVTVAVSPRAATAADGSLTTGATLTQTFSRRINLPGLSTLTAVGADIGGSPTVTVLNPDGSIKFSQVVFAPTFTGGVRTAVADFNGDGVDDIVVGTGVGITTQVKVIDGSTRAELFSFSPFEASFTLGVFVTAGDVTGDGVPDLVVTPDQGGGPRVVIVRGGDFATAASFLGIDDANFRGGARAALGDFSKDGRLDLAVAAGFGGGPRVAVFDGTTVTSGAPKKLFNDFFVFEDTLRNGAYITAGDVNGDGYADLVAGGGPSGGPRVFALSGVGLLTNLGSKAPVLSNFFGGDSANRNGIRVAAKDLDGDGRADLVVGPGTGAGSRVTAYTGTALLGGVPTGTLWTADPFGSSFTGGVYVG